MRRKLGDSACLLLRSSRNSTCRAKSPYAGHGRRWVQISTSPGSSSELGQLPPRGPIDPDGPDAQFEVLGAPYSLLSATLSASQVLYTRTGTLVGVSGKVENTISTLATLQPFRRALLGLPFFYQKISSATPITALISTKSPLTSFVVVQLDGTQDWMIAQRRALLAWTGQSMSIRPTISRHMALSQWGNSQVSGRGIVALTGKGQVYQLTIPQGEQYVAHPRNVVAYSMNRHPPLPYRFASSTLRFEVPGVGTLTNMLPDTKFFRVMRESATWKSISRLLFAARTWARTTIWGDRLFLQFQGPTKILLQTRASRISDVLTSRDVNEIADAEPGVVPTIITLNETKDQLKESQEPKKSSSPPQPPQTTRMSYAQVGKDGEVNFGDKR